MGTTGWHEVQLERPIYFDWSKDLWIVIIEEAEGSLCNYPCAPGTENDANGRWLYGNGSWRQWGTNNYALMVRAYIEPDPMGVDLNGLMQEAPGSIVVASGSETNDYVPFRGITMERYLRAQYVIPFEDLIDMYRGEIRALIYYTTRTKLTDYGNAELDVYLKEVNSTTINQLIDKQDAQLVYHGKVKMMCHTFGASDLAIIVIPFDEPYTYTGGHLLVGIDNTHVGSFSSTSFYGETATGASLSTFGINSLEELSSPQQCNFRPMTAFLFEPHGQ